LTLPQLTPRKTVQWFPEYLRGLLDYDGIVAVSESSKEDLLAHWKHTGISAHPPVKAIPLGADFANRRQVQIGKPIGSEIPTVLMVATIEARKNHIALLKAAELLWHRGRKFRLRLIGGINRKTEVTTLKYLQWLQRAGAAMEWLGSVSDETLQQEYERCKFTIYPSLCEGFGLPVLESLSYGKPCICSDATALREQARGGGCLILPNTDIRALSEAIDRLLTDEILYDQLVEEARQRVFRTWHDYCQELVEWIRSLS
jgi:glycosyltransferase involved in cell wall biosynthesis